MTMNHPSFAHSINRRDFLRNASLLAMTGAVLPQCASGQGAKFVVAETSHGRIRGLVEQGIKIFRGVPYGDSTAGANRFMPAKDPIAWTGVRDALEYGHSAPQNAHTATRTPAQPPPSPAVVVPGPSIYRALGVAGDKPTGEGEDCLVLNLWTPAVKDGRKRPVLLWLHGGGFRGGSGSSRMFDGSNLARRGDVVVLTINHRLNVMGFANFSAFSPDFAASGQVGMLDIVQALKWVRTNIDNFGGDLNTVMIFGQSGGGRKCETLLAMPAAKGLFHRATIESGIAIKVVERENAVRNAELLLRKLNISPADVHKVQQLPVEQILAAHYEVNHELGESDLDTLGFAPSLDATNLPQHPFHPAASAVSPDVPIMIGSTRTEWTGLTTDASLWHLDEAGMKTQVWKLMGDPAEDMIEIYRKAYPGATPTDLYFLIASDFSYGAKTMKVAERRAALDRGAVYLYYFAWASPVQDGKLKTPHNMEIPFAFDNVQISANLTGAGAEAMALADKVSDTWIAFARTGNPNNAKMPSWTAFNAIDRATMVIDNQSKLVNDPLREQRIAMFRTLNLV